MWKSSETPLKARWQTEVGLQRS